MDDQKERAPVVPEVFERPPEPDRLVPHIVKAGNYAGQAAAKLGEGGGLRPLTAETIKSYCGVPVKIVCQVPNRLGGEAETLAVGVTLSRGPGEVLTELCEQVPALKALKAARDGLAILRGRLMTSDGPKLAAGLTELTRDPAALPAAAADTH